MCKIFVTKIILLRYNSTFIEVERALILHKNPKSCFDEHAFILRINNTDELNGFTCYEQLRTQKERVASAIL
jgi:hypothetical protein